MTLSQRLFIYVWRKMSSVVTCLGRKMTCCENIFNMTLFLFWFIKKKRIDGLITETLMLYKFNFNQAKFYILSLPFLMLLFCWSILRLWYVICKFYLQLYLIVIWFLTWWLQCTHVFILGCCSFCRFQMTYSSHISMCNKKFTVTISCIFYRLWCLWLSVLNTNLLIQFDYLHPSIHITFVVFNKFFF